MEYFNLSNSMPTVSAFVQQRNKLDYSAFQALFHTFTNSVDEQALFKGYRLLAVDGSDLHTPTNKDEPGSYYKGANGQKPYNLFHLNALFDLQRKIYIDAVVQESRCGNEHKAFVEMLDRDKSTVPTIYIADRGYESYNNLAHIIEKGQKFLCTFHNLPFGMNFSCREILLPSSFLWRAYARESGNLRCKHRPIKGTDPDPDGQPAFAGKERRCKCPTGADRGKPPAGAVGNPAI